MRTSATLAGGLCAALLIAGCGTTAATVTTSTTTPGTTKAATAPRVMTAEQITAAMQKEGFKTTTVTAYTAATDPNHLLGRQGGYTSKTEWTLADSSDDSVEVYPTTEGATKRVAYLNLFSGGLAGDGYDYQSGGAILRLSADLTPAQAASAHAYFLRALEV